MFKPFFPCTFINEIPLCVGPKVADHYAIALSLIICKKPLIYHGMRDDFKAKSLFLSLPRQIDLPSTEVKLAVKMPDDIFLFV